MSLFQSHMLSRLTARRSTVLARRFLVQQCTRAAIMAKTVPLCHHAQFRHLRAFSTPAPQNSESHLTIERYHELSDTTMNILLESLENLLDGLGRSNYEVEYHSGVLTLVLGDKGTYVINKQPPNKQIWLSSPFSGPKRYDYSEEADDWVYLRDSQAMGELLNDELGRILEQDVDLRLAKVSKSVP